MKTYRYAILPLFAFSLAVSSPVLADEGDSSTVPSEGATGSSSGTYENDAVGVDKTDDESAKLPPFENDPGRTDRGGNDAASSNGAGGSGETGGADGAAAGSGSGGNSGGGSGGNN